MESVILYIGKILMEQLIAEKGYGFFKKIFFQNKKYSKRLSKIIRKTIDEFEKRHPVQKSGSKFPFYHSQIVFEQLMKYVLFKKNSENIDKLLEELKKNPNIIVPSKEEIISFYELFYKNINCDNELKALFIEENYKEKIFENSDDLSILIEGQNRIGVKIDEIHSAIVPKKSENITIDELIHKLDKDKSCSLEILKNGHYEPRYIRTSINDFEFLFFEEKRDTLLDITSKESRVVLLGNAGIGKTTELRQLFEQLWENRYESKNIPMYINLKNFRSTSTFEDLIPFAEWEKLPIVTFILDGLDEIANIQDFISALELFLNKNKDKRINTVISCRTNIYEKYLVKITDFKYFFLDNLTDYQINNILKKEISKELNYGELNQYRVYLQNPFNLKLFCEYYKQHHQFPEKQSDAWELFIENELKGLTKNKLIKRENIDTSHIKECLNKVAFVNELMQQNFIIEDNLYDLLGREDKDIFEQISFIEKLPDSDNYIFRHKNYQEFFAANYLANKNIEEIIDIIKIDETINKTKPSLFNTITFLLNILDEEKLERLKNWLLENEPEILFLTEKDKLDTETQKEIFIEYFKDIVLDKTFWIGKNGRFSVDKISAFADIDFLINIINEDKHRRATISAIDVLSYTECTPEEDEKIKNLLLKLIFSDNKDYSEKALQAFNSKEFQLKDKGIFLKIATHFENEKSHGIHHQLLSMVSQLGAEEYFEIFMNSLNRMYGRDRKPDDTMRGTKKIVERIILKINKFNNFIEILKILYNDEYHIKVSDFHDKYFENQLIEKMISFANNSDDDLFKIVDVLLRGKEIFLYRSKEVFGQLIEKLPRKELVFGYIIDNFEEIRTSYLMAYLFNNKSCIDCLVDRYSKDKTLFADEDITSLRNHYFYHQPDLGYYFEEKLKGIGFSFSDELPTPEEKDREMKTHKDFIQSNFDILFNIETLKQKVAGFFQEYQLETVNRRQIIELESNWHRETNYYYSGNILFEVIGDCTTEREVSESDVISMIEKEEFILYQIKSKIKNNTNQNFEVKPEQIDFIKTKCLEYSELFDYENVIESDDGFKSYYIKDKTNCNILESLYFFDKKYNINYSKDFYLKTLRYTHLFLEDENPFQFIEGKVEETALSKQVTYNLNNVPMFDTTLSEHMEYAIKNEIQECYPKIGEIILSDQYTSKDFLAEYVNLLDKNTKVEFLKKCCENTNPHLSWQAVGILLDDGLECEYLLNIAKKYLKSQHREQWFISNALDVLFHCNDEEAFTLYIQLLKDFKSLENIDLRDDYIIKHIDKYYRLDKLDALKEIFEIIYDKQLKDPFDYYHSRQNYSNLIINLSKNKEGYNEIQRVLAEIKEQYFDYDQKFYVNNYIEASQNSYYSSLSKKYSYEGAKAMLVGN
ncbi:NACHT domain-containing protein [Bergeyella zoohelcum]|uniref:NACHT domain-containing protein n=1 Tax=Bergeyella zoohelcum TaxID=1015 RepID=UPI003735A892